MQLGAYLSAERLTHQAFGNRVGVTHSTVHKWVTGKLLPAWDKIVAIEAATGGAVAAEDFAEVARRATKPPHGANSVGEGVPPENRSVIERGVALPDALLREARACGIDAASVCHAALSRAVGAAKAARWQAENRAALEAHARYVEEHGLPLGRHRMF